MSSNFHCLVIVADGIEELEFVAIVDLLRRANIKVTIAGVEGTKQITGARGMFLTPETGVKACIAHLYHAVIIPGGKKAADIMQRDSLVGDILLANYNIGQKIGAINSGPLVLMKHRVGSGRRITSYPTYRNQLACDFNYVDGKRLVRDGHVITAQGPGSAMEFAFEMIQQIYGESGPGTEIISQIKTDMCF